MPGFLIPPRTLGTAEIFEAKSETLHRPGEWTNAFRISQEASSD